MVEMLMLNDEDPSYVSDPKTKRKMRYINLDTRAKEILENIGSIDLLMRA